MSWEPYSEKTHVFIQIFHFDSFSLFLPIQKFFKQPNMSLPVFSNVWTMILFQQFFFV